MNILAFSTLLFKKIINKNIFTFVVLFIILLSFILIPNDAKNYVTIYIGDYYIISNKFSIGTLAAILSNIIIPLCIIFLYDGENKDNKLSNNYIFERISPLKKIQIDISKIFSIYILSIFILFILNFSIILNNLNSINIFYYIKSLIYYNFTFLFLVSIYLYYIEYFISPKYKYIIYFAIIFLFIFLDHKLNMVGINELSYNFMNVNNSNNRFAIGYIPKHLLKGEIILREFPIYHFINYKIIFILINVIGVFFLSKIDYTNEVSLKQKNKQYIDDIELNKNIFSFNYTLVKIKKNNSFFNLLIKDFFLFKSFFKKKFSYIIYLLIFLMLVKGISISSQLIPISILLISIYLNTNFLNKLNFYNISFYEKIAPYSKVRIFISKLVIVYVCYIIILCPYFLDLKNINEIMIIMLNISLLSLIQIIYFLYFNKPLLINILITIVFCSYYTGSILLDILLINNI